MPGNTHFVKVCEHGIVISQCRCIGPKTKQVVPCLQPAAHADLPVAEGSNAYVGKHRKPGTPNINERRAVNGGPGRHRNGNLVTGPA